MSQDMSWVFRLFDNMSGPASKIGVAVHKVADQLEAAAAGEKKFTREQSRAVNTQARLINSYARFTTALTKLAKAQGSARTEQEKFNAAQARSAKIAAQVAREQSRAAKAAADARAAEARAARAVTGSGGGGGSRGREGNGLFGMGLGLAGWYVSFRAVEAAVERIVRTVTAIPKAVISGGIEHTALKESSIASIGTVLGDKAKAAALVKEAVRFAAITPLTTEETLKGYTQLAVGGMAPNRIMGVMSAVSDLSSLNMDNREQAVAMITRDLMEIEARGKVTGRHLLNLGSWGLPREELTKQLASGFIPGLAGASSDTVEKAISAGKVSSEAFFIAFQNAMAKKGGGVLGGISAEQSHTVYGLWSTLISRPQELLMNMDQTPAWGKLKDVLENVVNALDYNTPTGSRIQQTLTEAFSRWVTALTSWLSDPAKVEQWITSLIRGFDAMIPLFEKSAAALASAAENLGRITGGLGAALKVFGIGWDAAAYVVAPGGTKATAGQAHAGASLLGAAWNWADNQLTGGTPSEGVPSMLQRPSGTYNFNINVTGVTKEDAKAVASETGDHLASILESFNLQRGVA